MTVEMKMVEERRQKRKNIEIKTENDEIKWEEKKGRAEGRLGNNTSSTKEKEQSKEI